MGEEGEMGNRLIFDFIFFHVCLFFFVPKHKEDFRDENVQERRSMSCEKTRGLDAGENSSFFEGRGGGERERNIHFFLSD